MGGDASDDALGAEKWGAGPTAVLLKQEQGWTYGALTNHVWSFTGSDSRQDVNATFLQPFLSYTTETHTTFGVNTESTYDWENSQWTVPINAQASQLLKLGSQPVQFTVGARYYADIVAVLVCGELLILRTHKAGKFWRGDLVIMQPGTFYHAYDGLRGM